MTHGVDGPADVFPFFVGSGRSGTTLFRNVFDSHPKLAMMHEGHFVGAMARVRRRYEGSKGFAVDVFVRDLYNNDNFRRQGLARPVVEAALESHPPRSLPDAVRTVFRCYAEAHGKPYYGDKTPGYVSQIGELAAMFPDAKFVHIIRDGRDVALSYLERHEWGPATMAEAAFYWRSRVGRGRAAGHELGARRYREVRYEDMVEDPEGTTRSLCRFLQLEYDAAMLDYHHRGDAFARSTKHPEAFTGLAKPVTKGMRDWRVEIRPDDAALFETIAGELLEDLGYDVTGVGGGLRRRGESAAAAVVWQAKRVGSRAAPLVRRAQRKLKRN